MSIIEFETIMNMNYNEFNERFQLWESGYEFVSILRGDGEGERKREGDDCLTVCDGVYADFLDWAYFNRHLLEFLTMEDISELAPSFYSHDRRWYIVNKKDQSFRNIRFSLSPPALRRSSLITNEEIHEFLDDAFIGEEWIGPFPVSPNIYLDEHLLRDYLVDLAISFLKV
jgi:hypothetical protein